MKYVLHLPEEQLSLATLVTYAADTVAAPSGETHLSCIPH